MHVTYPKPSSPALLHKVTSLHGASTVEDTTFVGVVRGRAARNAKKLKFRDSSHGSVERRAEELKIKGLLARERGAGAGGDEILETPRTGAWSGGQRRVKFEDSSHGSVGQGPEKVKI